MLKRLFVPEGWNEKTAILDEEKIEQYKKQKRTLQGIVEKCDEDYNLYINLGNNIQGIIPREEVEGIILGEDGLPKTNLCTGKVNKYVQFKIKEIKENNVVVLSRKQVQQEAIRKIKSQLNIGDFVVRNSEKNRKLWGFYRNWWRRSWIGTYRRFINCKNKNTL